MRILVSVILLSFATQINSRCNVCNRTSLYACFSIDQFIPCDVSGIFNVAAIGICAPGMFCNHNLGVGTPCGDISSGVGCLTSHVPLLTTTMIPSTTVIPTTSTTTPTTSTTSTTTPTTSTTSTTTSTTSTTSTNSTTTPTTLTTSTSSTTSNSTSTITAKDTTPLSSFNVNTFCSARAFGRYAHPSYTTCANYVYCFSNGTTMIGAPYTCVGATWFNPATQYCDPAYACAG